MNHEFNKRYNEYFSNDPTKKATQENQSDNNIVNYEQGETGQRNICFILQDGKQIFLSYNYLIAAEYSPEDNLITLTFTTHKVELKGYNLQKLFEDLRQHFPKTIKEGNDRYKSITVDTLPLIINIYIDLC